MKFYTFNSIDGQGVMVYLAQSQNPMAQLIQTILDIFSVFVAVVLACLILYANTFLIRRRKRELGTYLLLGLSQRQVSGLLVLETLVIGLISLAAGLLLGLAASQGLSALTLSMFSIRVDAFALAFSPRAAVRTVSYFGLIFLLVMLLFSAQARCTFFLSVLVSVQIVQQATPVHKIFFPYAYVRDLISDAHQAQSGITET